jgi:hypothetical protein
MNTYNWIITDLYTKNVGKKSNYVVIANYEVIATDGTIKVSVFNECKFIIDEKQKNFTPYESLTNDIVVDWVKQTIGENEVTKIINHLDLKIEKKKTPSDKPKSQKLPF